MQLSVEKEYLARTLLIISVIVGLGMIAIVIISEDQQIKEIQTITDLQTIKLIQESKINLTSTDFEKMSEESSQKFSQWITHSKLEGLGTVTVWNKFGELLFSTDDQQPTKNIYETDYFTKVVSGQTIREITKIEQNNLDQNSSGHKVTILTNLNFNGSVMGIIKYEIMTFSTTEKILADNSVFILTISGIVFVISLMTLLSYVTFKKKLLAKLLISEQKVIQKELDLKNIRNALNESSIISITDDKGMMTYVNNKFADISQYSSKELIGKNQQILKSGFHDADFFKNIWKTVSNGFIWEGEIKNKAKDGTFYWVKSTIVPLIGSTKSENKYISIGVDITKQMETEEKLANALETLKGNDKLKNEFASMVSHELRTPLTPIVGYCGMLLEPDFLGKLNAEQIESVGVIKANAQRLEKMIGDVLDAQKIELNEMTYSKKDFELKKFLLDMKNDLAFYMIDKNIKFEVTEDVDCIINSDETRLRQILDNLVKNSVDFVPQVGGMISVGVKDDTGDFQFYVKDNGIGISEESQKHLFKKFYQVDTSMTRKHGGTGLGLVVCKGLVEGLGGKIWVESEEGKGATFYFKIPKITVYNF